MCARAKRRRGFGIRVLFLFARASRAKARRRLFVALGLPHRKPSVKYVGYGGGLIHRTADEAEAAMAEYESDPLNFGRAAAKDAAKAVETAQYELVSGFQDNGGDMMERPSGARARFTNAKKAA